MGDQEADGQLDSDFAEQVKYKADNRKTLDPLIGCKIQTELDRKLVLGVWKSDEKNHDKGPRQ